MTTGLRERKKLSAMRRIQAVALDLFDQLGFESVTIEQIADGAEVSPSSVYRYFGTKEQVVLWDEGDIEFLEVVAAKLSDHPPVEAVRLALAQVLTEYFAGNEERARRMTRLLFDEPALRTALFEAVNGFTAVVAQALVHASGRDEADLDAQVIATVLVGALVVATRHWHESGYAAPLGDEMERALAVVENGLKLDHGNADRG
ncbi:MAG: TetR/AcrR family transcriptional regulator [Dehalococcoidia bacterium]